jgi:chemotaxis signal transduction protein
MQVLMFRAKGEIFCLPISDVSEVLEKIQIFHLPRLSDPFEGIFHLRGKVIPLLNFSRCFWPEDEGHPGGEIFVFAEPHAALAIRIPGMIDALQLEGQRKEFLPVENPVNQILDGIVYDNQEIYHLLSAEKMQQLARTLVAEGSHRVTGGDRT